MNNPVTTPHDERNIRLLTRHWQWLEAQPRGINANLRQLVEMASRDVDGRYRAASIRESCYLYMRDMAGDRPHFEEAVRALFAHDRDKLQQQISSWPLPVQRHICELLDAMPANGANGAA
ncbi:DUF2239 family protein [Dyella japonica]|uniref:DUF2239 family protein n=1 Tax=Dyella japonica TaxID=231455 RepID=UPI0003062417|nr:DUF2239 family protein [Dyella japonica]